MEMNWSRWFRCESSFGLLLVPNQPGIFALAEEVIQPGAHSRRMLAVFEIEEADDLARGLSRLFAAGSPWREKLAQTRCYIRYTVAPSIADRQASVIALKSWLQSQREAAQENMRVPSGLAWARPESSQDDSGAGEMRNERRIARADEGGAAQCCGALEKNELKTMAERAVDRVTYGMKLAKASTTAL